MDRIECSTVCEPISKPSAIRLRASSQFMNAPGFGVIHCFDGERMRPQIINIFSPRFLQGAVCWSAPPHRQAFCVPATPAGMDFTSPGRHANRLCHLPSAKHELALHRSREFAMFPMYPVVRKKSAGTPSSFQNGRGDRQVIPVAIVEGDQDRSTLAAPSPVLPARKALQIDRLAPSPQPALNLERENLRRRSSFRNSSDRDAVPRQHRGSTTPAAPGVVWSESAHWRETDRKSAWRLPSELKSFCDVRTK